MHLKTGNCINLSIIIQLFKAISKYFIKHQVKIAPRLSRRRYSYDLALPMLIRETVM